MSLASAAAGRSFFKAPLAVGDIAPDCVLRGVDGATIDLRADDIAGRPTAILFCPKFTISVMEAAAGFRAHLDAFIAAGATLIAITLEPAKVAAEQAISFPVLLDRSGDTFRSFSANTRDAPTTIVLRPSHHVAAVFKEGSEAPARDALAVIEQLAAERRPVLMPPHPPVLVVPDAFSRDDCRRLIKVYEARGNVFVEPKHDDDKMATNYKMSILEYGRGDRIDHWLVEADTTPSSTAVCRLASFPRSAAPFSTGLHDVR